MNDFDLKKMSAFVVAKKRRGKSFAAPTLPKIIEETVKDSSENENALLAAQSQIPTVKRSQVEKRKIFYYSYPT